MANRYLDTREDRQHRVKRIAQSLLSVAALAIFYAFLRAFGLPTDTTRLWAALACTLVLVGPVAYFVGTKIAEIR